MPNWVFPHHPKAVLFDVDGTLVDSLAMILAGLGDTFERVTGKRPNEPEIRRLIGMPLTRQIQAMTGDHWTPDELAEIEAYAMQRYTSHLHLLREFDDAVLALRRCHQAGLKTALVTSKNAAELEEFLGHFSACDALTTSVCASDVSQPKPNPEAAQLACARLGVAAKDAFMIGDSIFDLRCAHDAGMASVAVLYGSGEEDALRQENPAYVVATPAELLTWIDQTILENLCPGRN